MCFRFISFAHADTFAPFHVWTFEDGDMEDWSNDNNNGQLKWHVEATRQSSFSVCVSAKTSEKKSKKFFSPTSFSKKTFSRLWSPSVSSTFGINCLTIQYAIERAGHDASLSLLLQSSGYLFSHASRSSEITADSSQTESPNSEVNICLLCFMQRFPLRSTYGHLRALLVVESGRMILASGMASYVIGGPAYWVHYSLSYYALLELKGLKAKCLALLERMPVGVTANLPLFHQGGFCASVRCEVLTSRLSPVLVLRIPHF